jgi:hypothetical protein
MPRLAVTVKVANESAGQGMGAVGPPSVPREYLF